MDKLDKLNQAIETLTKIQDAGTHTENLRDAISCLSFDRSMVQSGISYYLDAYANVNDVIHASSREDACRIADAL